MGFTHYYWLLVSIPFKYMKVDWDDDIPSIWENKPCSSHHQPVLVVWNLWGSFWIIGDYTGNMTFPQWLYMTMDYTWLYMIYPGIYGLYMIIHGISLFHMDPWPPSEKVQRTLQMIVNYVPVTLPQRVQLDP